MANFLLNSKAILFKSSVLLDQGLRIAEVAHFSFLIGLPKGVRLSGISRVGFTMLVTGIPTPNPVQVRRKPTFGVFEKCTGSLSTVWRAS